MNDVSRIVSMLESKIELKNTEIAKFKQALNKISEIIHTEDEDISDGDCLDLIAKILKNVNET